MSLEEPVTTEESQKNEKNPAQLVIELVELMVKYVREQAQSIAYDSFFAPMEQAKKKLFGAIIGAFAIGIALIFLGIGFVFTLMLFLPAWAAYLLIGAVLLVIGIVASSRGKNGKTTTNS